MVTVQNVQKYNGVPCYLTGDVDDWDGMLALNLSAPMRLTHAFAPSMVSAITGNA